MQQNMSPYNILTINNE